MRFERSSFRGAQARSSFTAAFAHAGGQRRAAVRLLALPALLLIGSLLAVAQEQKPDAEKLAPYYPTPESVVERMLKFAGLKPGEKLFDLGSGDGRIVVIAAQKFGANATGIELDAELVKQSTEKIRGLGLEKRAHIVHGDILRQDYSSADVLAVYLLPRSNERLRPILEKQLRNGTRVVAHDFVFRGWTPEREEYVEDDGAGRSHTIYLYVIHK